MKRLKFKEDIKSIVAKINDPSTPQDLKVSLNEQFAALTQQLGVLEKEIALVEGEVVERRYDFGFVDFENDEEPTKAAEARINFSVEEIPQEAMKSQDAFLDFLHEGGIGIGKLYRFNKSFYYRFVRISEVKGGYEYLLEENLFANSNHYGSQERERPYAHFRTRKFETLENLHNGLALEVGDFFEDYAGIEDWELDNGDHTDWSEEADEEEVEEYDSDEEVSPIEVICLEHLASTRSFSNFILNVGVSNEKIYKFPDNFYYSHLLIFNSKEKYEYVLIENKKTTLIYSLPNRNKDDASIRRSFEIDVECKFEIIDQVIPLLHVFKKGTT